MAEYVTLDLWVELVFDQPDDFQNYEEPEALFQLEHECRLGFLAETFENSGEMLARFSDGQINQALWHSLIGMGAEYVFAIRDESLPWDLRRRALWSFVPLFQQVMSTRCNPTLSHFDEKPSSPLNSFCYMWWDSTPLCSSKSIGGAAELDTECLAVMERILQIPHVACQESALHGLGHWKFNHPDEVVKIIDEFLERERDLRPELIAYAEAAKTGCIQ